MITPVYLIDLDCLDASLMFLSLGIVERVNLARVR